MDGAAPFQGCLFRSEEDLALRVPVLAPKELTLLARVSALNKLEGIEHSPGCVSFFLCKLLISGQCSAHFLRRRSNTHWNI